MYSFTLKSKVFKILTYIRQERPNEQHCTGTAIPWRIVLPNTVSQKDEKPHTARLDDTAIPHIKIKITEIPLEKKAQYRNTVNPHVPLNNANSGSTFWSFFPCRTEELDAINKLNERNRSLVGQFSQWNIYWRRLAITFLQEPKIALPINWQWIRVDGQIRFEYEYV